MPREVQKLESAFRIKVIMPGGRVYYFGPYSLEGTATAVKKSQKYLLRSGFTMSVQELVGEWEEVTNDR